MTIYHDNKSTLIVKNSKISDCVIKINDNNSKNSDGTYSGGIVGKMAKNSCLYGYNISLDNVQFKNNENPCTCPPDFPVCVCGKKSKGKVITRKPILPSEEELEENKRAKSAKLRVFERRR